MANEPGKARCLTIGLSVCLRRLRKALPAAALVFGLMCLGWGAGKLGESYGFFPRVIEDCSDYPCKTVVHEAPAFGWESLVFGALVAAPLTFIFLLHAWVYFALLELGQAEISRREKIQPEFHHYPTTSED